MVGSRSSFDGNICSEVQNWIPFQDQINSCAAGIYLVVKKSCHSINDLSNILTNLKNARE